MRPRPNRCDCGSWKMPGDKWCLDCVISQMNREKDELQIKLIARITEMERK